MIPGTSSKDIAVLLATVDSRTGIRIHTYELDAENVGDWLLKMVAWSEGKADLRLQYAKAIATSEPRNIRKYIQNENFYNPNNEILKLGAALRRGDAEMTINTTTAISNAHSQSLYARAMAAGYGNLVAAAKYYLVQSGAQPLVRG